MGVTIKMNSNLNLHNLCTKLSALKLYYYDKLIPNHGTSNTIKKKKKLV